MKKLAVFDLDFTLWDAGGTWCDHTEPPYTKVNNHIEDSLGRNITLYPEVRDILQKLSDQSFSMALASRTNAPHWAKELLLLFKIEHFFLYQEIYPGSKTQHFYSLQKQTNIMFDKMVFFDDEMRNIREVGSLGVDAIYIKDGITSDVVFGALCQ
jgi:magnesium-dependent phosphatase 1